MDFGTIVVICTTIVATIAGVATIISTIRYMKSENSKVLKDIAKGQREGLSKLSEDNRAIIEASKSIAQILERINGKIKI